MIRIMSGLVLIASLAGCAAVGVPSTNDPMEKLGYAYQLMGTDGRGLAAEKLGKEALAAFQEKNNSYGIAEAHTMLGSYYKSPSYRFPKGFYRQHDEYDETASKSISHLKSAIEAFTLDGDYWGVSKATFVMANAYATDDNTEMACTLYKKSLAIYLSDENVFKGRVHTFNPQYNSYEEMIRAFIKDKCEE